jgi:hypothetical protein
LLYPIQDQRSIRQLGERIMQRLELQFIRSFDHERNRAGSPSSQEVQHSA